MCEDPKAALILPASHGLHARWSGCACLRRNARRCRGFCARLDSEFAESPSKYNRIARRLSFADEPTGRLSSPALPRFGGSILHHGAVRREERRLGEFA